MADLALVEAPAVLWRVERAEANLAYSRIDSLDLASSAGNRFDVPGAGVLYAATTPAGAFAETLAAFRPSTALVARVREVSRVRDRPALDATLGVVDRSWAGRRRLRGLRVVTPLPFVDIDDPRTHTALTRRAAPDLLGVGLQHLDVATVRGPDRRVTRALAAWIHACTDAHGRPCYSGIRYASRLGPYECWAVFEGSVLDLVADEPIAGQQDLPAVMATFGLSFA